MNKKGLFLMIGMVMVFGLVYAGIIDNLQDAEEKEVSFITSQYKYSGTFKSMIRGEESKSVDNVQVINRELIVTYKSLEDRTYEECILFDEKGERDEYTLDYPCLEYGNVTYPLNNPNLINIPITKKDGVYITSKNVKDNKISYEIPIDEHYIKIGENSIIEIEGIISTATLINISVENDFTHLNITDDSPYDELVGYYPMDSNRSSTIIYDYSKQNNDGIINGDIFISQGLYGNATEYDDGDNNWITLPNSIRITRNNNFTFSAWIKADSVIGANYIMSQRGPVTSDGFLTMRMNAVGTITCFNFGSEGGNGVGWIIISPLAYDDNVWHHIVCRMNSTTTGTMYIDGIHIGSNTGVEKDIANGEFVIGNQANSHGAGWDGLIDEVMIFNNTISEQQILDIFNNQSARFRPTGTHGLSQNITSGGETVIVSGELQTNIGSVINLSIGYFNGSWVQTAEQIYSGANTFSINVSSTNITLNFTYFAGSNNGAFPFYTPHLFGESGITLTTIFPCAYTDNSGDYKCNNACSFSNRIMNVSDGSNFGNVLLFENCHLDLNNVTIIYNKWGKQEGVGLNITLNLTGNSSRRFAG